MYGFCSIETFLPGVGDLSATHDDAQGFYNYVAQLETPNFWFQDGGVQSWIYGEDHDNWEDFYGFDACTVVYHSGHGTMDGNGVFSMPMGANWGGAEWAGSNDMRLGNEMARYVFLSTCLSLRVHDGQNPIRTWDASNLGLRMLFGFETLSVDNPDYGRFFWEEWNKNKSFTTAWLDASWRISTGQSPSVVACGANEAEALDRLDHERLFFRDNVSKNWWMWRWYDAARVVTRRAAMVPDSVRSVLFTPPDLSGRRLAEAAEHYGIEARDVPDMVSGTRGVVLGVNRAGPTLAVDSSGIHEVHLADPDPAGMDIPDQAEAIRTATSAVESFGLAEDVDLVTDSVRHTYTAGGNRDERSAPRVLETTVIFRQLVGGMPIATPGVGEVRVSTDSRGAITRIVDATRPVGDVRDRATAGTSQRYSSVDDLLTEPLQRLLRRLSVGGHVPTVVRTVPDSTDVGYAVRGVRGTLVARRTVEVDCGHGLRKRYVIEAPVAS